MAYSLDSFVKRTLDHEAAGGELPAAFKVENHFLKVNLGTRSSLGDVLKLVHIKKGSMVGYAGSMKFEREGIVEHGAINKLKKTVTGEGLSLTKASSEGRATLFLADDDKGITALYLQEDDSVFVEGCKVLALAPTVTQKVRLMKTIAGISTFGMFCVELKGPGFIAILTKGDPMTLPVRPGNPVFTDHHATVAWSGNVVQSIHTDIHLKNVIGRSSGESLQHKFDCKIGTDGFVVIQPSEKPDEDAKATSAKLIDGTVSFIRMGATMVGILV